MRAVAFALSVFFGCTAGGAFAQVQGPLYVVDVRGIPMNCTSAFGEPVAIFLDPTLPNVGMARRQWNRAPTIQINPTVTGMYSDIVTAWWFAHECAHHALMPALNSEANADCFAVRQLRQFGILVDRNQLVAFQYELGNLPGSQIGHLPGPLRVQNIVNCALN